MIRGGLIDKVGRGFAQSCGIVDSMISANLANEGETSQLVFGIFCLNEDKLKFFLYGRSPPFVNLFRCILFYELTSDTTRTLIGQKSQKPMFYCTGKLPLPDKAALRSTKRKIE